MENENYTKAINLLTSQEKFHICLGLERVSQVLELLGNPQERLNIIHVAGTNGKGSTCAILSAVLTAAGFKTGLYTSPHILEYTERIKINGRDILQSDFADLIFEVSKLAKENNIYLTEFEILTVCAYKYFADRDTDICIIETGLGGRLDATSVISKNILSVITSISLDHVDRLGDTIEKIAFEKAGIIKDCCPVLLSAGNRGYNTISNVAKEKNSTVISAGYRVELSFEKNRNYALYNGKKYEFNLLGLWQGENLELVFETVNYLRLQGFDIPEKAVEQGLKTVNWMCRMQYIPKYNVLIDGTHNPDGARVLRESIDYYFPDKKRIWIYGSLITKDYPKVMQTLFRKDDEVYFYNFDYPNAVCFDELCKNVNLNIMPSKINLKELEYLSIENNRSLLVLSGSFYMLGQILKKSSFFQNIAKVVNIY